MSIKLNTDFYNLMCWIFIYCLGIYTRLSVCINISIDSEN